MFDLDSLNRLWGNSSVFIISAICNLFKATPQVDALLTVSVFICNGSIDVSSSLFHTCSDRKADVLEIS